MLKHKRILDGKTKQGWADEGKALQKLGRYEDAQYVF